MLPFVIIAPILFSALLIAFPLEVISTLILIGFCAGILKLVTYEGYKEYKKNLNNDSIIDFENPMPPVIPPKKETTTIKKKELANSKDFINPFE